MKNLEDKIKDSLDKRKIEPSPKAWEAIQEELAKSKKRKFALYGFSIAAAITLIGMVVFYENYIPNPKDKPNAIVHTTEKKDSLLNKKVNSIKEQQIKKEQTQNSFAKNTVILNDKKTITEESAHEKTTEKRERLETLNKQPKEAEKIAISEKETIENPKIETNFPRIEEKQEKMANHFPKDTHQKASPKWKINRDKMLYSVENEEATKAKSPVAVSGKKLTIDLNN